MSVYGPEEDSYFLKDFIEDKNLEGKKFLDMGTGTGIIALSAAQKGADVTAADKSSEALEKAKQNAAESDINSIDFVKTDLFENITGEFDLIVFNPPYLAGERISDSDALVGGEKGTEIIEEYLEDVGEYLKDDGDVYFVASSRSEIDNLKSRYDLKLVDSKNLWFERLYLFRFRA